MKYKFLSLVARWCALSVSIRGLSDRRQQIDIRLCTFRDSLMCPHFVLVHD